MPSYAIHWEINPLLPMMQL